MRTSTEEYFQAILKEVIPLAPLVDWLSYISDLVGSLVCRSCIDAKAKTRGEGRRRLRRQHEKIGGESKTWERLPSVWPPLRGTGGCLLAAVKTLKALATHCAPRKSLSSDGDKAIFSTAFNRPPRRKRISLNSSFLSQNTIKSPASNV